jgi:hypothetical protein
VSIKSYFKKRALIKEKQAQIKNLKEVLSRQLKHAKDWHIIDIINYIERECQKNDIKPEEIGTSADELKRKRLEGYKETVKYYIRRAKYNGVPVDYESITKYFFEGIPGTIVLSEDAQIIKKMIKENLRKNF